ncbi:MAG: alpha-amylase family glycosyl hydrolase [Vulcanimicrobiota bacterium]
MRFMGMLTFFLLVALIFVLIQPAFASDFSGDTIYFIVVDRFQDGSAENNARGKIYSGNKEEWKLYWGGDIQGIIDRLPYIKSLGCTAIWITPIIDNTEELYYYGENKEEKISAYHGYWGRDWWKINTHFGTKEKFQELIDKAHEMDIKIVFDYVLNHTSPINQGINGAIYEKGKYIADYENDKPDWFHHYGSIDFRKDDPVEWQNKNLFDLADLNTENPEVRRYIIESAKMWMDMGLDAFRLDTVRHIPVEFAKEFAQSLKKTNPDIFIFGEWSMGGLAVPGAVDFTRETGIDLIDFQFTFFITDTLCRDKSFEKLANYIDNDYKVRNPNLMVTCIDNHDMPRFISTAIDNGADMKTARRKTELATYIMMTTRGIPCIYYGTERYLHVDKKSTWGYGGEPYNRQMMTDWEKENEFSDNIKVLAQLRKTNNALSKGTQRTLKYGKNYWVYERRFEKEVVLVAVNKGKSRTINLKDVHLPDGKYDNSDYRFYRIMGPDIEIKNMGADIKLGKNQIGIWLNR